MILKPIVITLFLYLQIAPLASLTFWLLLLTASSLEPGCNVLKIFWELEILVSIAFVKSLLMSVQFLDAAGAVRQCLKLD